MIWLNLLQLDNDESSRFGSMVSKTYQKAFQVLNMLLPGTAFVYYGDEIAMSNGVVTANANKDPLFLDGKVLDIQIHEISLLNFIS